MLDNEKLLVEQAREEPSEVAARYDQYVDRIFDETDRRMQDDRSD